MAAACSSCTCAAVASHRMSGDTKCSRCLRGSGLNITGIQPLTNILIELPDDQFELPFSTTDASPHDPWLIVFNKFADIDRRNFVSGTSWTRTVKLFLRVLFRFSTDYVNDPWFDITAAVVTAVEAFIPVEEKSYHIDGYIDARHAQCLLLSKWLKLPWNFIHRRLDAVSGVVNLLLPRKLWANETPLVESQIWEWNTGENVCLFDHFVQKGISSPAANPLRAPGVPVLQDTDEAKVITLRREHIESSPDTLSKFIALHSIQRRRPYLHGLMLCAADVWLDSLRLYAVVLKEAQHSFPRDYTGFFPSNITNYYLTTRFPAAKRIIALGDAVRFSSSEHTVWRSPLQQYREHERAFAMRKLFQANEHLYGLADAIRMQTEKFAVVNLPTVGETPATNSLRIVAFVSHFNLDRNCPTNDQLTRKQHIFSHLSPNDHSVEIKGWGYSFKCAGFLRVGLSFPGSDTEDITDAVVGAAVRHTELNGEWPQHRDNANAMTMQEIKRFNAACAKTLQRWSARHAYFTVDSELEREILESARHPDDAVMVVLAPEKRERGGDVQWNFWGGPYVLVNGYVNSLVDVSQPTGTFHNNVLGASRSTDIGFKSGASSALEEVRPDRSLVKFSQLAVPKYWSLSVDMRYEREWKYYMENFPVFESSCYTQQLMHDRGLSGQFRHYITTEIPESVRKGAARPLIVAPGDIVQYSTNARVPPSYLRLQSFTARVQNSVANEYETINRMFDILSTDEIPNRCPDESSMSPEPL